MDKYLAHDAETGGTDPTRHSLLTYYAGIYTFDDLTQTFKLHHEIDLKIKPARGDSYVVTAEALGVNKINLIKHDQEALTMEQAAEKYYYFLKQHSANGSERLIRMGHNESFDRDFVINNLLKREIFSSFTDYNALDTVSTARGLRLKGKLPWNVRFKLEKLAEFLGVKAEPSLLHTAKGDTHLMVKCMEAMIQL